MNRTRVLVVDDEAISRASLRALLADAGYEVFEASGGEEALRQIAAHSPALVLSDLRMPGLDGLGLLRAAKAAGSSAAFVMMTGDGSIPDAVEAVRAGAESFLLKPLAFEALLAALEKALETRALQHETAGLRATVSERYSAERIIGGTGELQAVLEVIRRAAPTKATVLILGESGTGKELIAQALHEQSPRKDKPFIKVSCAALSESLLESELFGHERGSFTGAVGRREGRFEAADGGTLFLDEIGEITPAVQVKLLRVLQTRSFERVGGESSIDVDVRIVAATNRDLLAEVRAGRFREDLFYRLNVVAVTLPPLRRRRDDIPRLAAHFVEKYAAAYSKPVRGVSPRALQALLAHDWPGNVRELENAIERGVVLCRETELGLDDLPTTLRGPRPQLRDLTSLIPGGTMAQIEREAILRTLEHCHGSTARTAEMLGISVRTVQYRLKEYAAEPHPDEPPLNAPAAG